MNIEACPFPPGREPPRKPPIAQAIMSPVIKIKKSLPRKRYLLLALLLVTYFSCMTYLIMAAQVPSLLPEYSPDNYVYIDDVSITADGILVYSTSFPLNGNTDFPHNRMDEFTLTNPESIDLSSEERYSSPCSIRFDSSPSAQNNYEIGALSLDKEVAYWNWLNVTWYVKADAPGVPSSGIPVYSSVNHVLSARFKSQNSVGGVDDRGSYLETVMQTGGQKAMYTIHSGPQQSTPKESKSYWPWNYVPASCSKAAITQWDSSHWYKFSLVIGKEDNSARLYVDGSLVNSMFLASDYGPLEELNWLGFHS